MTLQFLLCPDAGAVHHLAWASCCQAHGHPPVGALDAAGSKHAVASGGGEAAVAAWNVMLAAVEDAAGAAVVAASADRTATLHAGPAAAHQRAVEMHPGHPGRC
jgi:hypothetical protein